MDIVELLKGASDNGVFLSVVFTILILIGIATLTVQLWKKVLNPFIENRYKSRECAEEKEALIASHTDEIAKLRSIIVSMQEQNNKSMEQLQNTMNIHITSLTASIQKLSECNEQQTGVMREQIKHSIVRACQDYIFKNVVKASELSAILKLYFLYSREPINGNTFVYDNVKLVCFLPILKDGAEKYSLMEDIHRFFESHGELELKSQVKFVDENKYDGMVFKKEETL